MVDDTKLGTSELQAGEQVRPGPMQRKALMALAEAGAYTGVGNEPTFHGPAHRFAITCRLMVGLVDRGWAVVVADGEVVQVVRSKKKRHTRWRATITEAGLAAIGQGDGGK